MSLNLAPQRRLLWDSCCILLRSCLWAALSLQQQQQSWVFFILLFDLSRFRSNPPTASSQSVSFSSSALILSYDFSTISSEYLDIHWLGLKGLYFLLSFQRQRLDFSKKILMCRHWWTVWNAEQSNWRRDSSFFKKKFRAFKFFHLGHAEIRSDTSCRDMYSVDQNCFVLVWMSLF